MIDARSIVNLPTLPTMEFGGASTIDHFPVMYMSALIGMCNAEQLAEWRARLADGFADAIANRDIALAVSLDAIADYLDNL